jgi:hypothetical protein
VTTILPATSDNRPAVDGCDCPTRTEIGSRSDRLTTRHRRSCPGRYAGEITIRHEAGTLDAVLAERFGATR